MKRRNKKRNTNENDISFETRTDCDDFSVGQLSNVETDVEPTAVDENGAPWSKEHPSAHVIMHPTGTIVGAGNKEASKPILA